MVLRLLPRARQGTPLRPGPRRSASVSLALRLSLSVFHRLLAPFLPFVCEEVWSWWQQGSVIARRGPSGRSCASGRGRGGRARVEDLALDVTAEALREVRKAKSDARRPMRAPVQRLLVRDTPERLRALELGRDDLLQAGSIGTLEAVEADEFVAEVELADEVDEPAAS